MVELVAQSHGLYIRLREKLGRDPQGHEVIRHAYERYQRRVAHLPLDSSF